MSSVSSAHLSFFVGLDVALELGYRRRRLRKVFHCLKEEKGHFGLHWKMVWIAVDSCRMLVDDFYSAAAAAHAYGNRKFPLGRLIIHVS